MTTSEHLFAHDDLEASEPRWMLDHRWDDVPAVGLDHLVGPAERVVVLAAHPDDETLGAAGLVHDLAAAGHEVLAVVASDGEASHPGAHVSRGWLAATRREECRAAMARLGAAVVFLGIPDGEVGVDQALDDLVRPHLAGAGLVLAPWTGDGHPDHERLGEVAVRTVAESTRLWFYPIWLWHWADAAQVPWDSIVTFSPSAAALHAKEAAIACHRSQVEAVGQGAEEGPVLTTTGLGPARRLVELFVTADPELVPAATAEQTDGATFDAMFDDDEDPWGFERSFYEQRKRSLTLAVLGRERYDAVLDVGCSTGVLTADLATRSDHVTGVDLSAQALRRAADRLREHDHVDLVHGTAHDDVPRAAYDLVVLSEVGYFLDGAGLLALLRRARRLLADGGELVMCHWRRPTDGIPLDGPLVHRQARAALDLPLAVSYEDDDLLLDVWTAGGSPATREGIA